MITENPYAAPAIVDVLPPDESRPNTVSLWSCAVPIVIGTGVSGCVFGLIAGPLGFIIGGMIAFPVATMVITVQIILMRIVTPRAVGLATCLTSGAVCGAVSGFLSVSPLTGFAVSAIALITSSMGACGGSLGALLRFVLRG